MNWRYHAVLTGMCEQETEIGSAGDLLWRYGREVPCQHYATYLGREPFPPYAHLVFEKQKFSGERIVTLEEFHQGKQYRLEPVAAELKRGYLLRLRRSLEEQKPYDLFVANCESRAREVSQGKMESGQVKLVGLVALVAFAGWALARAEA